VRLDVARTLGFRVTQPDALCPPVKLLPGERIQAVQELDLEDPETMPDAVEELCKLTGVERPEEIGLNGPAVAARVTEQNAGEPALRLFEVVFGRDSLTVALVVGDLFPRLLEATVMYLAEVQGRKFDALREEEPGRIVHEVRDVETDGLWGFPYYGAVDATPLFIRAAVRAIKGRPEFGATPVPGRATSVRDSLEAAVRWLLRRLAGDELGLLSYRRTNAHGLENQVWKDSWDSMSHADGTICNHDAPVASVEAQALAYDALVEAAALCRTPTSLLAAARRLERSVERHLWVKDCEGGFYAIGADRDPESGAPRPLGTRASNMGWLLGSRLLARPDLAGRRRRLVDLLFSEEFLAEGGIRTLSAREARFRPRAYHNGNIWGHDNYVISLGLARQGFHDEAQELHRRLAASCRATHRFPEFVAGGEQGTELIAKRIVDVYDSRNGRVNRVEQPPQEIQGWTVAAMVAIEHSSAR
jgi:glycogen debranching enzyme